MPGLLENPEDAQKALERKYKYIFHGFNELDFPFPEIIPTFTDMQETISKQLNKIEQHLKEVLSSEDQKASFHHSLFISALKHSKEELVKLQHRLELLTQGIIVERKTESDPLPQKVIVQFPYGECIKLCAAYSETCDLYYRVVKRFSKFGPHAAYFEEAFPSADSNEEIVFQEYLSILERQDYITAFHKKLEGSSDSDKALLLLAKKNNYFFIHKNKLLKEIYKKMSIPFLFQTPRYKYHLFEDLLYLDIILFPTMKSLSIEDFSNFRIFNFFPLGIVPDVIFADEFQLTSGDFFYHDVKHSLDMLSRNWVVYLEQNYCFTEAMNHFIQVKHALDNQIKIELTKLDLGEINQEKMRCAINVILFEIYHEEGYPYDYSCMIRALEIPNPFYGQHLIDFLKEKLTTMSFFYPENSNPEEIFNFPVDRLEHAKKFLLTCLYNTKEIAIKKGYKPLAKGYWEITRGKTQKNPYQELKGEKDYEVALKKIGNMFLIFKEAKLLDKRENKSAPDSTESSKKKSSSFLSCTEM